ncbi:MAG: metalloregulator ArsR/SmtB family transcription factor [Xanthomonadales bacterium]|jgi:DNA-binding transcriptional ArsR family regulator|nr:metalloregulator ArsR/SmtB family transcription factor [Xanthomonadales bacterium]
MVEYKPNLDLVFRALADPTRRAILASLRTTDRTVGDLAAPHAMSLAGASKHIGVLEKAGLVVRVRQGREVHCSLKPETLRAAEAWLQSYADLWHARLDRLDDLLIAEKNHD